MSLFVDSSTFYAAADRGDVRNVRAKELIGSGEPHTTTDHVLIETWLLLARRQGSFLADGYWASLRNGLASLEPVISTDLEVAWQIGEAFPDQGFSIVDRTSFAVMQRLGITRVATFDDDFAVYRYGRNRDRAFEVLR